jgi:membrane-bound lytic murein transglycosylase B
MLHLPRSGPATCLLLMIWLGCACGLLQAAEEPHPGSEDFVTRMVDEYGLDADYVRSTLAAAEYKQSIIDAITRPAEGKPWHEYRKIFLTQRRIRDGVSYWQEHADLIDQVAARFGIAPEVILAIIGVETSYGRNTGSYRVLDALVTLGFYYPRRAEFFSSELGHLFALSEKEQLAIIELTGSYAGAMGLGQFMPSSYQAYAVDFDADGVRDLWGSLPDASVTAELPP